MKISRFFYFKHLIVGRNKSFRCCNVTATKNATSHVVLPLINPSYVLRAVLALSKCFLLGCFYKLHYCCLLKLGRKSF